MPAVRSLAPSLIALDPAGWMQSAGNDRRPLTRSQDHLLSIFLYPPPVLVGLKGPLIDSYLALSMASEGPHARPDWPEQKAFSFPASSREPSAWPLFGRVFSWCSYGSRRIPNERAHIQLYTIPSMMLYCILSCIPYYLIPRRQTGSEPW